LPPLFLSPRSVCSPLKSFESIEWTNPSPFPTFARTAVTGLSVISRVGMRALREGNWRASSQNSSIGWRYPLAYKLASESRT
jgi:hypothetical protein